MDTVYRIHSDLRWALVVFAAAAAVWMAWGLLRRRPWSRNSRMMMVIFSTLVDIQVLVGIVYFIWSGIDWDYWPRQRFEHLVVMLVAAGVAHLPRRWRDAPAVVRYRNNLIVIVGVLVIIFVGVVLLPGGLDRWQF